MHPLLFLLCFSASVYALAGIGLLALRGLARLVSR
jgi:hypothetical protein